jgi:predicted dienelactone hydrolase
VFSPGFEESVLTYAAQVEDLASHGYIVAGIEHPYDSWATRFPDGRVIPFAQAPWDSAQREPNGAVAYQLAQIPPRADDIRFVLDRLVRLSTTPSRATPFAGHIDWTKIGAFGHSLGGVAAASACRSQTRIRACLNEDAEDDGRPYDGGLAAHVIKQPFLFFVTGHSIYASPRTPAPTAETLRQMKLTRAQYDSMANQNQHNEEAAMAAMPGGSYLVMAEAPDFTHGTFMDRKLLQSGTDSIARKQDFYMGLVRTYVRAFFDQTLLSRPSSALNRAGVVDSLITIERFGRPSP